MCLRTNLLFQKNSLRSIYEKGGGFVLFLVLILGMTVASEGEVTNPIPFHPLSNPQMWLSG